MPAMKTYTVTEVRRVEVSANDPLGAANLAKVMFEGKVRVGSTDVESHMPLGVWARPSKDPEIIETTVKKERY